MTTLTINPTLDRATWLDARKAGIGASEAAAACGFSPFKTPLDLYLEKRGEKEPNEQTREQRMGHFYEPMIAALYADETSATLAESQVFLRSDAYPFMLATLDHRTSAGRIVELKKVGWQAAGRWGESGTGDVPDYVAAQVLHQMIVADTGEADVAALIGDYDFRVYTIGRDEAVAARLVELEDTFWERVRRGDPPPIDPERDRQNLAYLYPEAVGEVTFDPAETLLVEQWEAAKAEKSAAEKDADRLKAEILGLMGAAGLARLADGRTLKRSVVTKKPRVVTAADVAKAGGELLIQKGSAYANLYLKGGE